MPARNAAPTSREQAARAETPTVIFASQALARARSAKVQVAPLRPKARPNVSFFRPRRRPDQACLTAGRGSTAMNPFALSSTATLI